MAYLGVPQSKLENLTTNVQIVNLSASFDGTTTTFNLQDSRGDAVYAVHERALLVILGGITQKPGVDYTTSGTTITFTTAPVSNLTIHIRKLYGVQRIIGVNDGVISPVKLSTGGPVWNSSGNVTISGDLNVTGAFNAGGNGLFWEDNERANFGDDNDLQIYHSGSHSFIKDAGEGNLVVQSNRIDFQNAAGSAEMARFQDNGTVSLSFNGSPKFETTSNGIKVHEDTDKVIEFSGAITQLGSIPGIQSTNTAGSGLRGLGFRGSEIRFAIGGSEQVRIASGGLVGIGNTSTNTPVERLAVYSEDDTSPIDTGLSVYRSTADDKVTINAQGGAAKFIADGGGSYIPVRFFRHNGTNTYETLTIGVDGKVGIGQTNPTSDLHIGNFSANAYELKLTGNALQFNRSSNSYIDQIHDTGNILFRMTSSHSTKLRINHDGTIKLPNDNQKLMIGSGDDLQLYHNGTDSYVDNQTGDLYIKTSSSGDDIFIQSYDDIFLNPKGSNGIGGENGINILGDGAVELYYDNSKKLETTPTGAKVTGALEVTQEYPTIRPTLDLNFAATKVLDDRITFTRDSVGTYVGEDGLIKYASNNVPRFDHDPTTGESLGLLIEESRTNKVSNSITMTASGTGSVSTNTTETTAPDGTNTAVKVTKSAGWNSYSEGTSTQGTVSWFAKKADNRYIQFQTSGVGINNSNMGGVTKNSVFDFDTETFTTNEHNISFIEYSNGWYRFYRNYTTNSQYSGSSIYLYPQTDASNGVGDTIDETGTVYGWGMQYEVGTSLSSYIPTSGDSVTRDVDSAKITGTNFTNFHNATEGTLYGEYKSTSETAPYIVMLSDGTDNNRTIINANYDSYQGVVKYNNGTNQAVIDGGTPIANANNKTALAFKKDDFALSLNGGTVATDTSGDVSVNNMMTIGSRHGIDSFANTTINAIKYYSKRLTNAQLQGLTQQ